MNKDIDGFYNKFTKIVLGGKENFAVTQDYLYNIKKDYYQKGYEDGFNAAYEKLFWNEAK